MKRLRFVFLALVAASDASAEPEALTGEVLKIKVPGAQIEIDTPIGTKIPMRFGHDGLVSGEAGVLGTFLGSAKDRGRWWIADDRLCIKWFRWFESQQRCMELKLEGTRIHWRKEDGETGTGTLKTQPAVAEAIPTKPKNSEVNASPASREKAIAAIATPQMERVAPASPPAEPMPAPAATAAISPLGVPEASPKASPEVREHVKSQPASAAVQRPKAQSSPSSAAVSKPRADANVATPAKTKAAPAPKTPTFRVARVDEDDMLNIRRGPSERSPAVGAISARGRGVEVTGPCHGEWCPVRHGGLTGWVNRYYLDAEPR